MNAALFGFCSLVELVEARFRRDGITLVVRVAGPHAKCPLCGANSARVHSSYWRRLADLPSTGLPVMVLWKSRRFFCDNPDCVRKVFTERCPGIAAAHGRRTPRLNNALHAIAVICGGEAGARLAERLGMSVSGDTLLRVIRRSPPPPPETPRVLGVDDWAFCRGQRYGTILCDLERHCIVDLLPQRSAQSFADWLRCHHGVELISRDRGDVYIKGAAGGAPAAIQVADRWHLLKNLRDAMERVMERHGADVKSAQAALMHAEPCPPAPVAENSRQAAAAEPPNARAKLVQQHRESRLRRFNQVKTLRAKGVALRAISRQLGISRSTVRRYAHADSLPERRQRQYSRGTDSYIGFLRRRWQEGCHNARQLTQELNEQGFEGSYYMVRRRVAGWRGDAGAPSDRGHEHVSPRQVAWSLLNTADELTEFEQLVVARLCDCCPAVDTVRSLAMRFCKMVRNRDPSGLDTWLKDAKGSELKSFARGIEVDKAGVHAGLLLPWSNGQTEGHVNRLKTLKRQMYGRASLDLLRLRLLAE